MIEDIHCPCDDCNREAEPPPSGWASVVVVGVALIVVILSVGSCWA